MSLQYSIFDECFVDSFAGGGGASTGIEMATGHPVDIAINHDEAAILMHRRNHPFTEHYREDVWQVDPVKAVRGRHVRFAWFSPDCKHFSRAKGKALVDKKIRGLAWIVLVWAEAVRPDVIMLENVPEFVTWGPIDADGNIIKEHEGETYDGFIKALTTGIPMDHPAFVELCEFLKISPLSEKSGKFVKGLGYDLKTNKLCAADYGAPTIRTRFHLIARCDGKPIVFPERTHAPRNSEEVKSGKCKPWRSAAEIINWDLPCPSIFDSKEKIKADYGLNVRRPLKENTLRRIARGLDKFVIKCEEPFIVPIGYGEKKGQKPRVHDINEPLPTVVGSGKYHVCDPILTPFHMHNHQNASGTSMTDPVNTVTANGAQMLVSPQITPYVVECGHSNGSEHSLKKPLNTVTGKDMFGLSSPKVVPYVMSNNTGNACHGADEPVPTVTTGDRNYLTSAHLIQYHSEQSDKEVRGQTFEEPIFTVDGSNRYGVSAAYLVQYFSGEGHYHSVDKPLATITTMEREGVTLAHLAHFKGQDKGQHPADPLMTITASDGQFADVRTKLVKWDGRTELYHWPEVRKLLNTYAGYNIADDEILLLRIRGMWYFISDIGMRMLVPRELYDAMAFPHDYVIDRDVDGNQIGRAKQVEKCGNAVVPVVAEALVRANLPEYYICKINDMSELHRIMVS
ncbi:MAG: DNA cytosine methyltransferase [Ruminococcaceae bacterium]|nr:DNA cytosine methyltransferase [Oscillospiraceae bacterium]